MDCLLLTLSSRATNPKGSRQRLGDIGMRSTLSPYVGHCGRLCCAVLRPCFCSKPHCHSHSHIPACGSLGQRVVSALQLPSTDCPHHWPQDVWHLQAASSAAKGSRGSIKGRMHLYLTQRRWIEIYLCAINSELQLTDIFYMNAIYYVITSLCLYNEINCFCEVNYPDLFFASS